MLISRMRKSVLPDVIGEALISKELKMSMLWDKVMSISERMVIKDLEGQRMFEFNLSELSQCALPSKNEIEFQFVEEDTSKTTV